SRTPPKVQERANDRYTSGWSQDRLDFAANSRWRWDCCGDIIVADHLDSDHTNNREVAYING
ncbi:MAG: hypothetical protein AB8G14_14430, partial [Ilumatobacter sp.]